MNLVEYDIEKDPGKNEEKLRKNPQKKIPLIDVEGIYLIGCRESEIKRAVEQRRTLSE